MSVIIKRADGDASPPDSSFRIPTRTWVVWIVVLISILVLTFMKQRISDAEVLSQPRFEELLNAGQITRGIAFYDELDPLQRITAFYTVPRDGGTSEVQFH